MLISSPSSREIRLLFDSEMERKDFEQWLRSTITLFGHPLPSPEKNEPSPPLPHRQRNDQQLAQLEKNRLAANEDASRRFEQITRNREGVLPWTVKQP